MTLADDKDKSKNTPSLETLDEVENICTKNDVNEKLNVVSSEEINL